MKRCGASLFFHYTRADASIMETLKVAHQVESLARIVGLRRRERRSGWESARISSPPLQRGHEAREGRRLSPLPPWKERDSSSLNMDDAPQVRSAARERATAGTTRMMVDAVEPGWTRQKLRLDQTPGREDIGANNDNNISSSRSPSRGGPHARSC